MKKVNASQLLHNDKADGVTFKTTLINNQGMDF